MANTDPPDSTRVFVSYSHDSREHEERVLALCERLRKEGMEVWLDQGDPDPPKGWPHWMMEQIEKADFVLVVCTKAYRRRFNKEEEPGHGKGVAFEASVITGLFYDASGVNYKFIPVTFSAEDEKKNIPSMLSGYTPYRLDTQEGYEALCSRLTRRPAAPRKGEGIRQVRPRRAREEEPSAGDSPAPRRERGKVVLPLVSLGVLISIAVAGAIMLRPPAKSSGFERRIVPFESSLASTNSVSWSPDDSASFVVVGRMTKDSPMKLLRYSLEGELVAEIPVTQEPLTAQRVGERLLVEHENVFVWYDKFLRQVHPYKDLLVQSQDGRDIRPYQWKLVGSNLYVLGDVPIEVENPGANGTEQAPPWERGVVHVPVDLPADFVIIQPLATDGRLSWLYRLGYPHLARVDDVDDRVYLLEMKDDLKILRLSRQARRRSDFPLRLKEFDPTPDFTQLGDLTEAYSLFENSAAIAGLYQWKSFMYVLSKCASSRDETASRKETTRWFLTRIDPRNGTPLYTLSLPTAAPHLTLAPGDHAWVILEQERFEAVDRNQGNRETSAFVVVPTREIDRAESPLVVDDSLSLCSYPARWYEDPPHWDYSSGAQPWR